MFIGTGTVITLNGVALPEILDVTPPGLSRETVPSSHMGTLVAHTFLAVKLYDGGELGLELGFDPDFTTPFTLGEFKEVVITFPDSGSTVWTFQAVITAYEPADPLEDRMTTTLALKVSGEVAIT